MMARPQLRARSQRCSDLKALVRANAFTENDHGRNVRARWSLLAARKQVIDVIGRALQDRFDRTVMAIGDPAYQFAI